MENNDPDDHAPTEEEIEELLNRLLLEAGETELRSKGYRREEVIKEWMQSKGRRRQVAEYLYDEVATRIGRRLEQERAADLKFFGQKGEARSKLVERSERSRFRKRRKK